MHQETTAALMHQLPVEYVQKPDTWSYAPLSMGKKNNYTFKCFTNIMFMFSESSAGENVLVRVPAGKVTVGKPQDFPSYGWDCDYGQMEIEYVDFFMPWLYVLHM